MFDLRTVRHTGELQRINLLSVFFLDQIKAGYTKVAVAFTSHKIRCFQKAYDRENQKSAVNSQGIFSISIIKKSFQKTYSFSISC